MPAETTYEHIRVETREPGIAWIALARPDVINAMSDRMKRELKQALVAAERDPSVRVVVLTGEGRGFCSGQDLADRAVAEHASNLGDALRATYNPLITQMRQMDTPIVGAINGVAAGAGMSLALACDLRIASETATFVEAFVKIGLAPDAGSTWFLPRLVGLAKAFELMALGDKVDAGEALRLGIVNRVVPAEQLEAETMVLAMRLAQSPSKAVGLMKRALSRAYEHDLVDQLEYEAHMQQIAGRTADFMEGVTAFLQKRPAAFSGR